MAFWVQKVLDFRQLLTVQALKTFMFEHGGMEGFGIVGKMNRLSSSEAKRETKH